ncbi:hypothetical protein CPAR01_12709 [Colletotrichum paranaense]|uniref:Protein kinase domain-containing protein n=1 Tax=Colletotrichum paranaense TaxID=1914294 RepID=A0ABQ9S775_9PEZI|nr:uncharacterized protein CPAR01_12709 [Colletotrichum paranaense]KAK1528151.1 hypothetical protein CPAR01_12709 [Colletotrichum paranaense]
MSAATHFNYHSEYKTAFEEFRVIREDERRLSKCGGEFIIVGNVTRRLEESSPSCHSRFKNDLDRLCQLHSLRRNSMQPPTMRLEDLKGYHCVFYILIDIGAPSQIDLFRENGLSDNKLPIDMTTLKDKIRERHNDDFLGKFYKAQLAWCPVQFELGMREKYWDRIMRILEKTEIKPHRDGRGPRKNTASLYSIEVPEEMVGMKLQKKMASAKFKRQGDRSPGFRYRFALKQFEFDKIDYFHNEARMFDHLRDKDGMISYIGWYQSLETDNEGAQREYHYIILELGDSDLYTAIRTLEPPVSPKEILGFWTAMSGISEALASIYKLKLGGVNYYTWHADIKPENILRVDSRYKLADPGEAYIQLSNGENRRQSARVTGGTRTYGAPEKAAYLDGRSLQEPLITQTSDVWSLGCVFSIAATYVVLGPQGVLIYDRIRRAGILEKTGDVSDTFHHDDKVLSEVTEWHRYLRAVARKTDAYTTDVLDMVDQYMLVAAPDQRFTAVQVRDWFKKRLEQSLVPTREVPSRIEDLLQDIELEVELDYEQHSGIKRLDSNMVPKRPASRNAQDSTEPDFKSQKELLDQGIRPTAHRSARDSPPKLPALTLDVTSDQASWIQNNSVTHGSHAYHAVYLVDNGTSMREHWDQATFILGGLVWRSLGYDENGMELCFTNPDTNPAAHIRESPKQEVETFTDAMKLAKPSSNDKMSVETMIVPELARIINDYSRAMISRRRPKKKTIIVLTDGVWNGMHIPNTLDEHLKAVFQLLRDLHKDLPLRNSPHNQGQEDIEKIRPITIQFVRFGTNEIGKERLRHLDDDLTNYGCPDLIDTEPADGDVYKMFLGSLCDDIDRQQSIVYEPALTMVTSPSTVSESMPIGLSREPTQEREPTHHRDSTPISPNHRNLEASHYGEQFSPTSGRFQETSVTSPLSLYPQELSAPQYETHQNQGHVSPLRISLPRHSTNPDPARHDNQLQQRSPMTAASWGMRTDAGLDQNSPHPRAEAPYGYRKSFHPN